MLIQAFLIDKNIKMDANLNIILILVALVLGAAVGIFIQRRKNTQLLDEAEAEAKKILEQSKRNGDRLRDEKIFQAKERFIEMKAEYEKVIFQREKKISDVENRLRDTYIMPLS